MAPRRQQVLACESRLSVDLHRARPALSRPTRFTERERAIICLPDPAERVQNAEVSVIGQLVLGLVGRRLIVWVVSGYQYGEMVHVFSSPAAGAAVPASAPISPLSRMYRILMLRCHAASSPGKSVLYWEPRDSFLRVAPLMIAPATSVMFCTSSASGAPGCTACLLRQSLPT